MGDLSVFSSYLRLSFSCSRSKADTFIENRHHFRFREGTNNTKTSPLEPKPPIDLVQASPCAEEVGLADVPDSTSHEEHHESKPCTPKAGGQQLPQELPATISVGMRIAFRRRIPFCYLLAALAFLFISSSSAVGLYFSIAWVMDSQQQVSCSPSGLWLLLHRRHFTTSIASVGHATQRLHAWREWFSLRMHHAERYCPHISSCFVQAFHILVPAQQGIHILDRSAAQIFSRYRGHLALVTAGLPSHLLREAAS